VNDLRPMCAKTVSMTSISVRYFLSRPTQITCENTYCVISDCETDINNHPYLEANYQF
jgi:hypothetical protein